MLLLALWNVVVDVSTAKSDHERVNKRQYVDVSKQKSVPTTFQYTEPLTTTTTTTTTTLATFN